MIKILLGNSSCAKWNVKNGQHSGEGYELFENFKVAKEKFQPDYFIYENNPLASDDIRKYISDALDTKEVLLNADIVSAQNRERLYYTNFEIPPLIDANIKLDDILDSYENYTLLSDNSMAYMCRTTRGGRNQFGYNYWSTSVNNKSKCINSNSHKGVPYDVIVQPYQEKWQCNNFIVKDNAIINPSFKCESPAIKIQDGQYIARRLTTKEYCRLQGYKDDYCHILSNFQAKRSLSVTWQYDILYHLFKAILHDKSVSEEIVVISLYDGIAGGRQCLKDLGFDNVTYYSYESNPYELQVATYQHPDIIVKGDALSIRHKEWDIKTDDVWDEFFDNTQITDDMLVFTNKHTALDLLQLQSLPLEAKIKLTKQRIEQWVNYWYDKNSNVHLAFSGGKDSTILKHIIDSMYDDIPSVFVDTGLEYPEVRKFVHDIKSNRYNVFSDNVIILRPALKFTEVINKYGYPVISKEVAQGIDRVKKYATMHNCNTLCDLYNKIQYEGWEQQPKVLWKIFDKLSSDGSLVMDDNSEISKFNYGTYKYLIDSPFKISSECCDIMKKHPAHVYSNQHNSHQFVGLLADESELRKQSWVKFGCNMFDGKSPRSTPLAFWTEQDILEYIIKYNVPIASVYGKVVHMDNGWSLTGVNRTGCMFCMFGAHLEKEPNRFQKMKQTHPKQYEYCMKSVEDGGLGLKDVIDWINENSDGKTHIDY